MTARGAPLRLAAEVARAAGRPGALRTLLLDLDGTLAPIAPTPERARAPRAVLATLGRLVRQGWTVAIVSGRPASQVRALVPVGGVRVFGGHGAEHAGRPADLDLPVRVRERLVAFAAAAKKLALLLAGARVEIKPGGVAIHDRLVPRADLRSWRSSVRDLLRFCDLEGLEVVRGRRVTEVRPLGAHKGTVLPRVVPANVGGRRDSSVVALGDDLTDEDLFRALRGRGLAVRVGRENRSTAAVRRLASPAAVRRFLEALAEVSVSGRPSSNLGTTARWQR